MKNKKVLVFNYQHSLKPKYKLGYLTFKISGFISLSASKTATT